MKLREIEFYYLNTNKGRIPLMKRQYFVCSLIGSKKEKEKERSLYKRERDLFLSNICAGSSEIVFASIREGTTDN